MLRTKKIVETIGFTNTSENGRITIFAITKMNNFLKDLGVDDYISHEVDRTTTPLTVRLTYKKTIKY